MVGTEEGAVVALNLRNRKTNNGVSVYDRQHFGSIRSIQRNPTHNKFFMTIGDWTTKIWAEDLKTPIITTKYDNGYLTGGCWSPTRVGVFYTINIDGGLGVWDFYHRQNEAAYTHKVGDAALSSIDVQGNGKLVAIGDVNGTVSLLKVCKSLASPQKDEKAGINNMFERETRREKNLEMREREIKRVQALTKKSDEDDANNSDNEEAALRAIDDKFKTLLSS